MSRFDLFGPLRLASLQAGGEVGGAVLVLVAAAGGKIAAEFRVEQGTMERGGRIAEEQRREEIQCQPLEAVGDVAGEPGRLYHGLAGNRFTGIEGVGLDQPAWRLEADFGRNFTVDRAGVEFPQSQGVDRFQVLLQRQVAVGVEPGVARMIVSGVELLQSFPAEVGNGGGLPARVVTIGGGRVEGSAEPSTEQRGRGSHRPLHFVVDYPLEDQR
jgi:hypothetical protein